MLKAGRSTIYLVIGVVLAILGFVGLVVPGLPGTPILLLALGFLSKGNTRLHDWLTRQAILRPTMLAITSYQENRTLSPKVKFMAQAWAWGSFGVVGGLSDSAALGLLLFGMATSCSLFMLFGVKSG